MFIIICVLLKAIVASLLVLVEFLAIIVVFDSVCSIVVFVALNVSVVLLLFVVDCSCHQLILFSVDILLIYCSFF